METFACRVIVVSLIVVKLLLLIYVFLAFFNRFPTIRTIAIRPSAVTAPAYGRIIKIRDLAASHPRFPNSVKISIFLSLFDIHWQFYPIDGVVIDTVHIRGRFARANDLEKSRQNEQQITRVRANPVQNIVTIKQVAGYFVRRIECQARPGATISRGDVLGRIRFGSRVTIVIPKPFAVSVRVGDHVSGPDTILGNFI